MRHLSAIRFAVVSVPSICQAITWVTISDAGVPGHEGFNGQMAKHETTNAQYCELLNEALADGTIGVYNDRVYAVADASHSEALSLAFIRTPFRH